MELKVTHIVNGLLDEEILNLIEFSFQKYPERKPIGIRVSNALHQRGIAGTFNDVPIAMDPKLYPDEQVEIVFESD